MPENEMLHHEDKPEISHFLAHINRLRYIKRWSLMRNNSDESVSEHTFHVCLIVHLLCSIANEILKKEVPTDKIVTLALFHDVTEVFTGDLPTPIKHHNKRFLSEFHKIEQMAAEQLVTMVPDELKSVYSKIIVDTPEADQKKYIKAADLLDAYLKCVTELKGGNHEFSVAKKQIESAIQKLQMEEVNYFMKHFAPAFELTIDEITELPERG